MKNIWIVNHNATPPQMAGLCRHYYFSKYLAQDGYRVRILTASTIHNTDVNMISGKEKYCEKNIDGVPYTFLKCSDYTGNGFFRIKNMIEFPIRLWQTYKRFERPDIIYTSSPDPFSAFFAILLAKWLKVPCVLEIRDLWPESIVCYRNMSRKNPIILVLYELEKWMYKLCDRLVFTIEGGYDYIKERGWNREIPFAKIFNINNGVDLDEFDRCERTVTFEDADLTDSTTIKIVYTGSIRRVNNLGIILDAAKLINNPQLRILIWGAGNEVTTIRQRIEEERIENVKYKGSVEKRYIPFILSKSDVVLHHAQGSKVFQFGCSNNKLFDYLAGGIPVLTTFKVAYSLIQRYDCGLEEETGTPAGIAAALDQLAAMTNEEREALGANARQAAKDFDFCALSKKILEVITFE